MESSIIETNDRFDRLTNWDISTHYRDREYWFMTKDFTAAFAYWVIKQSPYATPDIMAATEAFYKYVKTIIGHLPEQFTFEELAIILSEENLSAIPEIAILNERKNGRDGLGFCSRDYEPDADDDFIDIHALSRNIFYMMLRENITQS